MDVMGHRSSFKIYMGLRLLFPKLCDGFAFGIVSRMVGLVC